MTGDDIRAQILGFIASYTRVYGYPPTVRTIGNAVGLKSPSTVHMHLRTLQREGRLSQVPGSPRTLRVVTGDEP